MKKDNAPIKGISVILFSCFFILLFSVVLAANFFGDNTSQQQYVMLSKSFLEGKTYFLEMPVYDYSIWEGKFYWPIGPFVAVLLMPFVWLSGFFDIFFFQEYLKIFLIFPIFYFLFVLCRKYHFSKFDSAWLGVGFIFASQFVWVASLPTHSGISHVTAIFLLFAALLEYMTKRRYALVGTLMGFLVLTRITAGVGIVFFVISIFFLEETISRREKIKKCLFLLLPVCAAFVLLFLYNYVRFGDFLEQGYALQFLYLPSLEKAREYGLVSFAHLPGNLYHAFFAAPVAVMRDNLSPVLAYPFVRNDSWGVSIFVTAPYLLRLFFFRYKDRFSMVTILTASLVALPIFLYYGVGFPQVGYRYGLDFMPFLFLLFVKKYSEERNTLSLGLKTTIVASSLFNLYLMMHPAV